MTKEELFRAVGEVREDQITEAETVGRGNRPWRRYGAMAACLAVVLAGAFALERLEDARKWAALEEGFDTLSRPESAPDTGGGEDEDRWGVKVVPFHPEETQGSGAGLDGADYWNNAGERPASNYSVNVEIRELAGGTRDDAVMGAEEDRAEVDSASCLAWLSPEEIFARDTAIFRGTVRELRYYEVEEVRLGGGRTRYTVASVEVTDPIRGNLEEGEIRTVLYPGGPDVSTSLSGPLDALKAGSEAIFMPERTNWETGAGNGACYFCYADLAEYYLSEGLRYVFLDTGDGLAFERGLYEEIAEAETLDEIADYIRRMIGEAERMQPAAVPAEPQAAPAEIDPALLEPSYGVEGPNGGRELPDGAALSPEDLLIGG
ncbi:hypothetical protein [uncultured Oscillibacter sp.]|uniref:hypothetical protein n=1 Tax=uncultured Oscillibacter sp. TaxID=876091 RepID=UPI002606BC87|nr:hypothetical protein [uncultured Oscillibacter sp.]